MDSTSFVPTTYEFFRQSLDDKLQRPVCMIFKRRYQNANSIKYTEIISNLN